MNSYIEVEGDLIKLAHEGKFDVIAHGCNCFCRMKRGIAPQMAKFFHVNNIHDYTFEFPDMEGNIDKLGRIEGLQQIIKKTNEKKFIGVYVFNMYTQYHWNDPSSYGIPLDYDALRLCLRKLNYKFTDVTIGLPQIGCGLAGGDWDKVSKIIKEEITKNNVIIVKYKS